jgi:hypothetical protein
MESNNVQRYIPVPVMLSSEGVDDNCLYTAIGNLIDMIKSIKHDQVSSLQNEKITLALLINPDFYALVSDTDTVISAYARIKAIYQAYVLGQSYRDVNGFVMLDSLNLPHYTTTAKK